ncbi:MAG: tRNA pseudouridine(38-40) synthase TruA [Bifidobacteriaceae bacterium]|nr:tRNA pseudouridine(38-40) synthase TruA [Bifidobacteriaceae bacterium]
MTARFRLDLAYDGSAFHGWARQPGLRTVQGVLESALARLTRAPVALTAAGRTDAGVHARGQVCHLDLAPAQMAALAGRAVETPPGEALGRRLNAVLPPEVRLLGAAEAPGEFDARFSALWREYRYRVADGPAGRDPLERAFTWWTRPLDAAAMAAAGQALVGEHDFLPFAVPRPGASSVRTVLEVRVERLGPARLDISVRADAFCHRMVRFMVGALEAVGQGRRPVAWVGQVLAAGRRDPGVPAAPALGLVLERVAYPQGAPALAQRARRARAHRGQAAGQSAGLDA